MAASPSTFSPSHPPPSHSPPPAIRYFDLLPPELLRHILRQIDTLPHSDHEIRQMTLHSLCRTSKVLHEIAQPLLLKRIYVVYGDSERTTCLPALLAAKSIESLAKVQTVHLTVYLDDSNYFGGEFEGLVRKATGLQEVFINGSYRAVQILGGTNITTLSLWNINLDQNAGPISFPQLANLSLYSYERLEISQLSVPKLKHLALIPWRGFMSKEVLFLDQVAPTLTSLTIEIDSSSSLPTSIRSSPISLLLRIELYYRPSTLPPRASVRVPLPNARDHAPHECASARIILQHLTKLASASDHQLEDVYLAIRTEGGGGSDKVNPVIEDAVNDFVAACRDQGIPIFWEEATRQAFADGTTFADLVPASFVKRSEARYAEAHRM